MAEIVSTAVENPTEESKVYTITLSDGTKLENITMNGSNYVSQTEITEADFEGKLAQITISDGETEEVMENVILVQIVHYADGYYFVLIPTPESALVQQKLRSDVDYLALMSDIDLEA